MRTFIYLFCFVFVFNLKAQDVHFSQFSVSSMGLNPALVGNQSVDFKASFQKRTQWASVAKPFSSIAANFEVKDILKKTSVGFQFLNDMAGDANFTTSQFNAAISNSFSIDRDKDFSTGILLGFTQRKVDFAALIFEQDEQLQNPSFIFFDLGIGSNYSAIVNDNFSFITGLSVYHINKPKQTLLNDENVRLKEKYNSYLLTFYRLNNTIIFNPALLYSRQGKSSELLFGTAIRHELSSINMEFISQIFYRWDDAIIPAFGLNYNSIIAVISYDINTSDLVAASQNKGGFEFSIIYMWNKKKRKQRREIKKYCPKYL
jgi:type IX secretion system PorP/SprF family membrane protein|tara:strand:- start:341 stop:1291 length:951 start_codon:yes stop_codon:yes gene_type:complete